ncbi:hypothetical protein D1AOALGA4SA_12025 [Olavius algarvensis Delta 1 endosymbiont]|nr:hypothetical protein D1AOALGA4SA_12025 [Olavius algarvensis Delta 1 endosymbiont]
MSAELVGEASVTAVILAGWQPNENSDVKPKENTAKLQRAKKTTVKPKTAAGIGCVKKVKKTWMMQLPHGYRHGVYGCCGVSHIVFFMHTKRRGAIFAKLLDESSMSSPVAAMVKSKMKAV